MCKKWVGECFGLWIGIRQKRINRPLTFKLTLKRIEGVKNVKRRAVCLGTTGFFKQTTLWNFGILSSLLKFAGGLMGAWSEQRENFCAFDTLSSRKRGIIFARLSHRHWSRCFSAGFRYVYFVVHIRIPMVNSF